MLGLGLYGLTYGASKVIQNMNRGHTFRSALLGTKLKPPVAAKRDTTVYFGIHPDKPDEYRGIKPMNPPLSIEDPYYWMRDDDRKSPEVLWHLEAENRYCEQGMKPLLPLQKVLYDEMVGHMKETDEDAPYVHGPYLYYSKSIKGMAYRIHCRKLKGTGTGTGTASDTHGPEEVILDENKLAEGRRMCDVGTFEVSQCHKYLAYSIDYTGYETYIIKFVNLETGEYLPDSIEDTDGSVEWGRNGTVFYMKMDDTHRSCELWAHSIASFNNGQVQADVLLRREDDGLFNMNIGKTQDGKFLLMGMESSETSEQYMLDLSTSPATLSELNAVFVLVCARKYGVRYDVEHHDGKLLIVTNVDGAKSNKLCVASLSGPTTLALDVQQSNWKDVKPYDATVQIQYVLPFENHLVIVGRHGGLRQAWTVDVKKGLADWYQIAFPEPIYFFGLKNNKEYNTNTLRLSYSSYTTPMQTRDYNMNSANSVVLKEQEVPGYVRTLYESRRLFATARDGTQIPISLVAKKTVLANIDATGAGAPLLLDGYGSYGHSIDPVFDSKALSLLDRNFVFCVAHIRGGGEMGKQWHEDHGKYLQKMNTFNDFADCAKHLINKGYTSSDRLGICGRSAGGLLMGAVVNRDPDLYKACVASVPFVDVTTTMCDPTIPLTTGEWEEWGNPNEEEFYEYMKSYSPIDNVVAQRYPSMFISGGLNDPRVAYWEPAKWVAKLRELKTNSDDINPIYFKTDMSTGHFSASDRYAYMKERSIEYSFLIDQLTTA